MTERLAAASFARDSRTRAVPDFGQCSAHASLASPASRRERVQANEWSAHALHVLALARTGSLGFGSGLVVGMEGTSEPSNFQTSF